MPSMRSGVRMTREWLSRNHPELYDALRRSPVGDVFRLARFSYRFADTNARRLLSSDEIIQFDAGPLSGVEMVLPAVYCPGGIWHSPYDRLEVPGYFNDAVLAEIIQGNIWLDAGAYPGDSMIAALAMGAEKVAGLEPDERNYRYAQRVLSANLFETERAILFPEALSDRSTEALLHSRGSGSHVIDQGSICYDSSQGIPIQTITLDAVLRRLERLGWLPGRELVVKMDIEGDEVAVVKDFAAHVGLLRPSVAGWAIASYHLDCRGIESSNVLEPILNEAGYRTYTGYPRHKTTYAIRSDLVDAGWPG